MLTRLRLKNWRSLKDVVIEDLKPITVFIGANSSGKSNIIDALYFLRDSSTEGALRAVQNRGGLEKVYSIGTNLSEPIEIEMGFQSHQFGTLTYLLGLEFDSPEFPIPNVAEVLKDADGQVWINADYHEGVNVRWGEPPQLNSLSDPPFGWEQTVLSSFGNIPMYSRIYDTYQYITQRWQMLDENFMPSLSLPADASGDVYVIDRCGDNLPLMLDFMFKVNPELYAHMQEDLAWLLGHLNRVETISDERETRVAVKEQIHPEKEAPTVSAGTARIVAILTAYYALAHRKRADAPGLVVIEEPDTALNPGLLSRFVGQLREYVEGEHPRQFILTTHNPAFLDLFEPDEVRIVERDEHGFTNVRNVPDYIREIWLDKYGLGEVWTTNSFGGLPE